MKKVLLVSPAPPPIGGITSWTIEYMNQMPELGCIPILVNTTVTKRRLKNNAKINLFDEFLRLRAILKNIKKALQDEEIQVLHYNASCFTLGLIRDYIVLRPLFKKVAVVYQCHCNLETNINNKVARCFFSKIAKRAKCVLTLNKNSFHFAEKYTSNIKIIPNFIDQIYTEDVHVRRELKDIAFVGRVCCQKGIQELMEAAKAIEDVNVHIIGPDDGHMLDTSSDKLNVIFHGSQPHDKVIELLKTMDAIILPSYTEGFPLVVMEGMACGLPIIATTVGAIPDMIEENGGILIPVHDSNAIVDAIESIRSSNVRQEMALHNLHKVENEYLSKCVLQNLLDIYTNL